MQMQQGNVLSSDNVLKIHEKKRQLFYQLMVALLQFAATPVRFDITHTVGQYAGFCHGASPAAQGGSRRPPQGTRGSSPTHPAADLSAGPSHTAALHHLVEYLQKHPSFELDYHVNPKKNVV